jgi:hypothetical protein
MSFAVRIVIVSHSNRPKRSTVICVIWYTLFSHSLIPTHFQIFNVILGQTNSLIVPIHIHCNWPINQSMIVNHRSICCSLLQTISMVAITCNIIVQTISFVIIHPHDHMTAQTMCMISPLHHNETSIAAYRYGV